MQRHVDTRAGATNLAFATSPSPSLFFALLIWLFFRSVLEDCEQRGEKLSGTANGVRPYTSRKRVPLCDGTPSSSAWRSSSSLPPRLHVDLLMHAKTDSSLMRRASFIRNHLWATPYSPQERFPAGEYPNQHVGGEGLVAWTKV